MNDMEDRYAATDCLWSGNPNAALVTEVRGMNPGTALDIGAGEGADAAWLYFHGWGVTAVEPSPTAAGRIRDLSDQIFVLESTFEDASIGTYDLVMAFYTPLIDDEATLTKLTSAVKPGGTLLVVHHADCSRMAEHVGRPEDDFLLPDRIAQRVEELGDEWSVEKHGPFNKNVSHGAGAGHTTDVLVRVKRAAS